MQKIIDEQEDEEWPQPCKSCKEEIEIHEWSTCEACFAEICIGCWVHHDPPGYLSMFYMCKDCWLEYTKDQLKMINLILHNKKNKLNPHYVEEDCVAKPNKGDTCRRP